MQVAVISAAVILGGSILGAALLVTQRTATTQPWPQPRYTFTIEVEDMPQGEKLPILYRLDTITGDVEVCSLGRLAPLMYVRPDQPPWCAKDFTKETHR